MRKITRKGMIKKLDKLMTEYVLVRDGERCVICGSRQQLGNGHYFSRSHYATRWLPLNCHTSCWPCNFRHEFNPWPYSKFMVKTYGSEVLDKLEKTHNQITKFSIQDLQRKYDLLKTEIDKLKSQH